MKMPPFIIYILNFILQRAGDILHDIWMVDFNIKAMPFIKDFPGNFLFCWDIVIYKYYLTSYFLHKLKGKQINQNPSLKLEQVKNCAAYHDIHGPCFYQHHFIKMSKPKSEPRKLRLRKMKLLRLICYERMVTDTKLTLIL